MTQLKAAKKVAAIRDKLVFASDADRNKLKAKLANAQVKLAKATLKAVQHAVRVEKKKSKALAAKIAAVK